MRSKMAAVLFVFLTSTMLASAAVAGPDEEYLSIYFTIEKADALNASGKQEQAKAKYEEAQKALKAYQKNFPTSNVKAANYRVTYVAGKLAALTQPAVENPASTTIVASRPATRPPSTTASQGDSVRLVSAGSEPHTALRLRGMVGTRQAMTMTMNTSMTMAMGEMPGQTMKMPPITMTLEMIIKSIAPNGDMTYEGGLKDVSMGESGDPTMDAMMKASMEGAKTVVFSATLTPRGQNKGVSVRSTGVSTPESQEMVNQIKESFTSSETPFPEEPVGAGAKWEVKGPVTSQGMKINQTAVYELVSVEGDIVKIKSITTQQAGSQTIDHPMMPGMKAQLAKMTGKTSADVTINLSKPLVYDSTITEQSDTSMTVDVGGQKQAMNMKMDTGTVVKSN